jgi:hypothetical protein
VAFVTGQAEAKGMRERKGGNARSVGLGGQEGKAPEKKDGTNGLAVRAGRPVTQTTSGLENLLHNRNKYTIA